jgi:4-amino-4-deoxy-L-arabinose transferase-like glycosyltransferase
VVLQAQAQARTISFAAYQTILLLVSSFVFFTALVSPPSLMDDVDASHGQLARNMLNSGDWVVPRLDGVPYLEKAPLPYWMVAVSYRIFGVHDWAARIPFALAAVLLCWITACYGRWAFGERAGFYAGMALSTCIGLFLFTRILIPDVMVALCACLGFWSFQRLLEPEDAEPHPRVWAALLAASLGVGVMLKGLIALVLPAGGVLLYLAITQQLFRAARVWRRLRPWSGLAILLLIAAPWHVLATLRMPPHFAFTLHSGPGQYHGFFWFYFINEHVLRFLGRRYPHDYSTVPRAAFWLLNLLWLFPWSAWLPPALRLNLKPEDRAARTGLLALCWTAFLLVFFSFSTTQEYYSMPVYPALALLIGAALDREERWLAVGTRIVAAISTVALAAVIALLLYVRNLPALGDISSALAQHPEAYTLSLGHMGDLTLNAFAYLRAPLFLAGLAFALGAAGAWLLPRRRALIAIAAMMVLFFQASRLALAVFDPYLSSRSLAQALAREPAGQLIVDGPYYPYSSVLFYADRTVLLLNGRRDNLEYGSYAPGAPPVFIDDADFARLWLAAPRSYLLTDSAGLARISTLVGPTNLLQITAAGGKLLLTNLPPMAGSVPGRENRHVAW